MKNILAVTTILKNNKFANLMFYVLFMMEKKKKVLDYRLELVYKLVASILTLTYIITCFCKNIVKINAL